MEKALVPKRKVESDADDGSISNTAKSDTSLVQLTPTFKDKKTGLVKKQNILEEDEYIEAVDKIIERDFFPDLPKLQLQTEYVDALNSNDIEKLRAIELKLDRGLSVRRFNDNTPSVFETPTIDQAKTPSGDTETLKTQQSNNVNVTDKTPNVSLDKFLAKHTSEDNASFERIMEESKLRIRDKFAWLFKAEGSQADKQNANLALPSCEEQAQKYLDDKPYNLDSWTYKSRNALMYVPKGVELSSVEIIEQKGKKEREIKHENTRFNADPFNSFACKAALTEAASVNANIKKQVGKVGVDGSLEAASVTPTAKGYGFVATPSPAPGADMSPFMTWGEIEGTPMRLDATPGSASGPTFKIPEPPRREQLGHQLVEKMSKEHRNKRREAIARAAASIGKSPGRSSTDRITQLSPAAQRLVQVNARLTGDSALRSSYSPSPRRSATTPTTPNIQKTTPNVRSSRSKLSAANKTDVSLTDNLLQLPRT